MTNKNVNTVPRNSDAMRKMRQKRKTRRSDEADGEVPKMTTQRRK